MCDILEMTFLWFHKEVGKIAKFGSFKESLLVMKFRSKTLFFKNQSEMRYGSLWFYFFVLVIKTGIWWYNLKNQNLWFILMTSSILTLLRAVKKLSQGTITNWLQNILFWPLIWCLHTKIQTFIAFNFTELYRKVRKLTEGQNFSQGTILRVRIETLSFSTLITQREVT